MTDDLTAPSTIEAPAAAEPKRPARRSKPRPGKHGTGTSASRSVPVTAQALSAAPPALKPPLMAHTVLETSGVTEGGGLVRPSSRRSLTKGTLELLGLEDTISVATALAVLRGEAVTLHIETTGPDPLRDEVIAIHARRARKHRTIAELSLKVLPLRALPAATAEDGPGEAARPPAKRQNVTLQDAITRLLEFLGTHRQHVFVHGSAGAQAFLGQAARQYGMVIENPVGDVVDLARLAWPGRADYSLSGLAEDLLPELGPIRTTADATKVILGLLQAASKVLTANGGLVSKSIVHWGTSPDTIKLKPSPW